MPLVTLVTLVLNPVRPDSSVGRASGIGPGFNPQSGHLSVLISCLLNNSGTINSVNEMLAEDSIIYRSIFMLEYFWNFRKFIWHAMGNLLKNIGWVNDNKKDNQTGD